MSRPVPRSGAGPGTGWGVVAVPGPVAAPEARTGESAVPGAPCPASAGRASGTGAAVDGMSAGRASGVPVPAGGAAAGPASVGRASAAWASVARGSAVRASAVRGASGPDRPVVAWPGRSGPGSCGDEDWCTRRP
uniref:Glycosyl transferase family 51 n=1 Tax=Streptomyces pactum TaxID=68249 RepID=B7TWN7_9ACTN|nr:glycosyl transferase family 51 [Streptomyces pactum]